jgi:hypothetical protein
MTHTRIRMSDLKHGATLLLGVLVLVSILFTSLSFPVSPVSAQASPAVFRVDAQGNITKNGTIYPIRGASWFGLEGRHEPSNDPTNPSGAPMEQYIGNVFWAPSNRTIAQDVAEFKAMGINVIRLPLVPQTLDPNNPQGREPYLKNTASVRIANSRLALETVIKALDAAGIDVLLDIHSCSNYLGWRAGRLDARPPYADFDRDNYDFKRENYSCAASGNPSSVTTTHPYNETMWLNDLRTLAGLGDELGVSNIIGIDIFNEPWDYTWQEWKTLTEHAYQAINEVNPNVLIFVQGISASAGHQDGSPTTITQVPHGNLATNPNWGENLYEAGANPPNVPKERLVYSPHTYGPSVFVQKMFMDPAQPQCAGLEGDAAGEAKCNIVINPTLLRQGWEEHFGYLKDMGYAIVIGEWGGNMDWPRGKTSLRDQARYSYLTDSTVDEQWQNAFVDYLIDEGITDTIYWSVNPESGDTGGLYTTPYQPGTNESGWGTWGALDSRKMTLVNRLWNAVPQPPTATPTSTVTPGGPTITPIPPTNTLIPPTSTNTPASGGALKVQLKSGGTDNNQQSAFHYRVQNTGASAVSNISVRIYFTLDGSQAASKYVLEKYYDQSGAATISGPTQVSGSSYYFTVNYGTQSLPAGAAWEYHTALRLSDWSSNYVGTNDWWHTTGALPASYTDWANIPAYVSGSRVWGGEPGGTNPTATNTPVQPTATSTNTPVGPTATNTPIPPTATRTNTPIIPTATPTTGSGASCVVSYVKDDWGSGFTANLTIANNGSTAINGWTLAWSFSGNQTITNLWNGAYTQSGQSVSVTNLGYNGSIPVNGNVNFGFNANYSGSNAIPANFTLNGVACSSQ